MARHMLLRHGIPAAMFNGHACFGAHRFETNLDVRVLRVAETGLTPAEREALARLPDRDAANLEDAAVRLRLDQAPLPARVLSWFERQHAGALRRELKELIRPPPCADLARENFERALRRGGHAQRHLHARTHPCASRCALNDSNCPAHMASVCSSHAFNSAIGVERST